MRRGRGIFSKLFGNTPSEKGMVDDENDETMYKSTELNFVTTEENQLIKHLLYNLTNQQLIQTDRGDDNKGNIDTIKLKDKIERANKEIITFNNQNEEVQKEAITLSNLEALDKIYNEMNQIENPTTTFDTMVQRESVSSSSNLLSSKFPIDINLFSESLNLLTTDVTIQGNWYAAPSVNYKSQHNSEDHSKLFEPMKQSNQQSESETTTMSSNLDNNLKFEAMPTITDYKSHTNDENNSNLEQTLGFQSMTSNPFLFNNFNPFNSISSTSYNNLVNADIDKSVTLSNDLANLKFNRANPTSADFSIFDELDTTRIPTLANENNFEKPRREYIFDTTNDELHSISNMNDFESATENDDNETIMPFHNYDSIKVNRNSDVANKSHETPKILEYTGFGWPEEITEEIGFADPTISTTDEDYEESTEESIKIDVETSTFIDLAKINISYTITSETEKPKSNYTEAFPITEMNELTKPKQTSFDNLVMKSNDTQFTFSVGKNASLELKDNITNATTNIVYDLHTSPYTKLIDFPTIVTEESKASEKETSDFSISPITQPFPLPQINLNDSKTSFEDTSINSVFSEQTSSVSETNFILDISSKSTPQVDTLITEATHIPETSTLIHSLQETTHTVGHSKDYEISKSTTDDFHASLSAAQNYLIQKFTNEITPTNLNNTMHTITDMFSKEEISTMIPIKENTTLHQTNKNITDVELTSDQEIFVQTSETENVTTSLRSTNSHTSKDELGDLQTTLDGKTIIIRGTSSTPNNLDEEEDDLLVAFTSLLSEFVASDDEDSTLANLNPESFHNESKAAGNVSISSLRGNLTTGISTAKHAENNSTFTTMTNATNISIATKITNLSEITKQTTSSKEVSNLKVEEVATSAMFVQTETQAASVSHQNESLPQTGVSLKPDNTPTMNISSQSIQEQTITTHDGSILSQQKTESLSQSETSLKTETTTVTKEQSNISTNASKDLQEQSSITSISQEQTTEVLKQSEISKQTTTSEEVKNVIIQEVATSPMFSQTVSATSTQKASIGLNNLEEKSTVSTPSSSTYVSQEQSVTDISKEIHSQEITNSKIEEASTKLEATAPESTTVHEQVSTTTHILQEQASVSETISSISQTQAVTGIIDHSEISKITTLSKETTNVIIEEMGSSVIFSQAETQATSLSPQQESTSILQSVTPQDQASTKPEEITMSHVTQEESSLPVILSSSLSPQNESLNITTTTFTTIQEQSTPSTALTYMTSELTSTPITVSPSLQQQSIATVEEIGLSTIFSENGYTVNASTPELFPTARTKQESLVPSNATQEVVSPISQEQSKATELTNLKVEEVASSVMFSQAGVQASSTSNQNEPGSSVQNEQASKSEEITTSVTTQEQITITTVKHEETVSIQTTQEQDITQTKEVIITAETTTHMPSEITSTLEHVSSSLQEQLTTALVSNSEISKQITHTEEIPNVKVEEVGSSIMFSENTTTVNANIQEQVTLAASNQEGLTSSNTTQEQTSTPTTVSPIPQEQSVTTIIEVSEVSKQTTHLEKVEEVGSSILFSETGIQTSSASNQNEPVSVGQNEITPKSEELTTNIPTQEQTTSTTTKQEEPMTTHLTQENTQTKVEEVSSSVTSASETAQEQVTTVTTKQEDLISSNLTQEQANTLSTVALNTQEQSTTTAMDHSEISKQITHTDESSNLRVEEVGSSIMFSQNATSVQGQSITTTTDHSEISKQITQSEKATNLKVEEVGSSAIFSETETQASYVSNQNESNQATSKSEEISTSTTVQEQITTVTIKQEQDNTQTTISSTLQEVTTTAETITQLSSTSTTVSPLQDQSITTVVHSSEVSKQATQTEEAPKLKVEEVGPSIMFSQNTTIKEEVTIATTKQEQTNEATTISSTSQEQSTTAVADHSEVSKQTTHLEKETNLTVEEVGSSALFSQTETSAHSESESLSQNETNLKLNEVTKVDSNMKVEEISSSVTSLQTTINASSMSDLSLAQNSTTINANEITTVSTIAQELVPAATKKLEETSSVSVAQEISSTTSTVSSISQETIAAKQSELSEQTTHSEILTNVVEVQTTTQISSTLTQNNTETSIKTNEITAENTIVNGQVTLLNTKSEEPFVHIVKEQGSIPTTVFSQEQATTTLNYSETSKQTTHPEVSSPAITSQSGILLMQTENQSHSVSMETLSENTNITLNPGELFKASAVTTSQNTSSEVTMTEPSKLNQENISLTGSTISSNLFSNQDITTSSHLANTLNITLEQSSGHEQLHITTTFKPPVSIQTFITATASISEIPITVFPLTQFSIPQITSNLFPLEHLPNLPLSTGITSMPQLFATPPNLADLEDTTLFEASTPFIPISFNFLHTTERNEEETDEIMRHSLLKSSHKTSTNMEENTHSVHKTTVEKKHQKGSKITTTSGTKEFSEEKITSYTTTTTDKHKGLFHFGHKSTTSSSKDITNSDHNEPHPDKTHEKFKDHKDEHKEHKEENEMKNHSPKEEHENGDKSHQKSNDFHGKNVDHNKHNKTNEHNDKEHKITKVGDHEMIRTSTKHQNEDTHKGEGHEKNKEHTQSHHKTSKGHYTVVTESGEILSSEITAKVTIEEITENLTRTHKPRTSSVRNGFEIDESEPLETTTGHDQEQSTEKETEELMTTKPKEEVEQESSEFSTEEFMVFDESEENGDTEGLTSMTSEEYDQITEGETNEPIESKPNILTTENDTHHSSTYKEEGQNGEPKTTYSPTHKETSEEQTSLVENEELTEGGHTITHISEHFEDKHSRITSIKETTSNQKEPKHTEHHTSYGSEHEQIKHTLATTEFSPSTIREELSEENYAINSTLHKQESSNESKHIIETHTTEHKNLAELKRTLGTSTISSDHIKHKTMETYGPSIIEEVVTENFHFSQISEEETALTASTETIHDDYKLVSLSNKTTTEIKNTDNSVIEHLSTIHEAFTNDLHMFSVKPGESRSSTSPTPVQEKHTLSSSKGVPSVSEEYSDLLHLTYETTSIQEKHTVTSPEGPSSISEEHSDLFHVTNEQAYTETSIEVPSSEEHTDNIHSTSIQEKHTENIPEIPFTVSEEHSEMFHLTQTEHTETSPEIPASTSEEHLDISSTTEETTPVQEKHMKTSPKSPSAVSEEHLEVIDLTHESTTPAQDKHTKTSPEIPVSISEEHADMFYITQESTTPTQEKHTKTSSNVPASISEEHEHGLHITHELTSLQEEHTETSSVSKTNLPEEHVDIQEKHTAISPELLFSISEANNNMFHMSHELTHVQEEHTTINLNTQTENSHGSSTKYIVHTTEHKTANLGISSKEHATQAEDHNTSELMCETCHTNKHSTMHVTDTTKKHTTHSTKHHTTVTSTHLPKEHTIKEVTPIKHSTSELMCETCKTKELITEHKTEATTKNTDLSERTQEHTKSTSFHKMQTESKTEKHNQHEQTEVNTSTDSEQQEQVKEHKNTSVHGGEHHITHTNKETKQDESVESKQHTDTPIDKHSTKMHHIEEDKNNEKEINIHTSTTIAENHVHISTDYKEETGVIPHGTSQQDEELVETKEHTISSKYEHSTNEDKNESQKQDENEQEGKEQTVTIPNNTINHTLENEEPITKPHEHKEHSPISHKHEPTEPIEEHSTKLHEQKNHTTISELPEHTTLSQHDGHSYEEYENDILGENKESTKNHIQYSTEINENPIEPHDHEHSEHSVDHSKHTTILEGHSKTPHISEEIEDTSLNPHQKYTTTLDEDEEKSFYKETTEHSTKYENKHTTKFKENFHSSTLEIQGNQHTLKNELEHISKLPEELTLNEESSNQAEQHTKLEHIEIYSTTEHVIEHNKSTEKFNKLSTEENVISEIDELLDIFSHTPNYVLNASSTELNLLDTEVSDNYNKNVEELFEHTTTKKRTTSLYSEAEISSGGKNGEHGFKGSNEFSDITLQVPQNTTTTSSQEHEDMEEITNVYKHITTIFEGKENEQNTSYHDTSTPTLEHEHIGEHKEETFPLSEHLSTENTNKYEEGYTNIISTLEQTKEHDIISEHILYESTLHNEKEQTTLGIEHATTLKHGHKEEEQELKEHETTVENEDLENKTGSKHLQNEHEDKNHKNHSTTLEYQTSNHPVDQESSEYEKYSSEHEHKTEEHKYEGSTEHFGHEISTSTHKHVEDITKEKEEELGHEITTVEHEHRNHSNSIVHDTQEHENVTIEIKNKEHEHVDEEYGHPEKEGEVVTSIVQTTLEHISMPEHKQTESINEEHKHTEVVQEHETTTITFEHKEHTISHVNIEEQQHKSATEAQQHEHTKGEQEHSEHEGEAEHESTTAIHETSEKADQTHKEHNMSTPEHEHVENETEEREHISTTVEHESNKTKEHDNTQVKELYTTVENKHDTQEHKEHEHKSTVEEHEGEQEHLLTNIEEQEHEITTVNQNHKEHETAHTKYEHEEEQQHENTTFTNEETTIQVEHKAPQHEHTVGEQEHREHEGELEPESTTIIQESSKSSIQTLQEHEITVPGYSEETYKNEGNKIEEHLHETTALQNGHDEHKTSQMQEHEGVTKEHKEHEDKNTEEEHEHQSKTTEHNTSQIHVEGQEHEGITTEHEQNEFEHKNTEGELEHKQHEGDREHESTTEQHMHTIEEQKHDTTQVHVEEQEHESTTTGYEYKEHEHKNYEGQKEHEESEQDREHESTTIMHLTSEHSGNTLQETEISVSEHEHVEHKTEHENIEQEHKEHGTTQLQEHTEINVEHEHKEHEHEHTEVEEHKEQEWSSTTLQENEMPVSEHEPVEHKTAHQNIEQEHKEHGTTQVQEHKDIYVEHEHKEHEHKHTEAEEHKEQEWSSTTLQENEMSESEHEPVEHKTEHENIDTTIEQEHKEHGTTQVQEHKDINVEHEHKEHEHKHTEAEEHKEQEWSSTTLQENEMSESEHEPVEHKTEHENIDTTIEQEHKEHDTTQMQEHKDINVEHEHKEHEDKHTEVEEHKEQEWSSTISIYETSENPQHTEHEISTSQYEHISPKFGENEFEHKEHEHFIHTSSEHSEQTFHEHKISTSEHEHVGKEIGENEHESTSVEHVGTQVHIIQSEQKEDKEHEKEPEGESTTEYKSSEHFEQTQQEPKEHEGEQKHESTTFIQEISGHSEQTLEGHEKTLSQQENAENKIEVLESGGTTVEQEHKEHGTTQIQEIEEHKGMTVEHEHKHTEVEEQKEQEWESTTSIHETSENTQEHKITTSQNEQEELEHKEHEHKFTEKEHQEEQEQESTTSLYTSSEHSEQTHHEHKITTSEREHVGNEIGEQEHESTSIEHEHIEHKSTQTHVTQSEEEGVPENKEDKEHEKGPEHENTTEYKTSEHFEQTHQEHEISENKVEEELVEHKYQEHESTQVHVEEQEHNGVTIEHEHKEYEHENGGAGHEHQGGTLEYESTIFTQENLEHTEQTLKEHEISTTEHNHGGHQVGEHKSTAIEQETSEHYGQTVNEYEISTTEHKHEDNKIEEQEGITMKHEHNEHEENQEHTTYDHYHVGSKVGEHKHESTTIETKSEEYENTPLEHEHKEEESITGSEDHTKHKTVEEHGHTLEHKEKEKGHESTEKNEHDVSTHLNKHITGLEHIEHTSSTNNLEEEQITPTSEGELNGKTTQNVPEKEYGGPVAEHTTVENEHFEHITSTSEQTHITESEHEEDKGKIDSEHNYSSTKNTHTTEYGKHATEEHGNHGQSTHEYKDNEHTSSKHAHYEDESLDKEKEHEEQSSHREFSTTFASYEKNQSENYVESTTQSDFENAEHKSKEHDKVHEEHENKSTTKHKEHGTIPSEHEKQAHHKTKSHEDHHKAHKESTTQHGSYSAKTEHEEHTSTAEEGTVYLYSMEPMKHTGANNTWREEERLGVIDRINTERTKAITTSTEISTASYFTEEEDVTSSKITQHCLTLKTTPTTETTTTRSTTTHAPKKCMFTPVTDGKLCETTKKLAKDTMTGTGRDERTVMTAETSTEVNRNMTDNESGNETRDHLNDALTKECMAINKHIIFDSLATNENKEIGETETSNEQSESTESLSKNKLTTIKSSISGIHNTTISEHLTTNGNITITQHDTSTGSFTNNDHTSTIEHTSTSANGNLLGKTTSDNASIIPIHETALTTSSTGSSSSCIFGNKSGKKCICSVDSLVKDLQEKSMNKMLNGTTSSYICDMYAPSKNDLSLGVKPHRRRKRSATFGMGREDSSRKREVIHNLDIVSALTKYSKFSDSGNHQYVTPGTNVRIPCADRKNISKNNNSIKWTTEDGLPITEGKVLETKSGDLVIDNVVPQDGGNYTCTMSSNSSETQTFKHQLSIIMLPMFDVNTSLLYYMSDRCVMEDTEIIKMYFNVDIGNVICGKDHRICRVDIKKCRCFNKKDKNYLYISLVYHMEPLIDIVPTLNATQCDIWCQLKIYAKLISVVVNNLQVFETQPVIYNQKREVTLTPTNDNVTSNETMEYPKLLIGCPPGFGLMDDRHICIACGPNSYSDGDESYCSACPKKQYQPSVGSKSCLTCTSLLQDPNCLSLMIMDGSKFKILAYTASAILVFVTIGIILIHCRKSTNSDAKKRRHDVKDYSRNKKNRHNVDVERQELLHESHKGKKRRKHTPPSPPPPDF